MKIKKEHVSEEWSEGHPDEGGDGYWIALKSGWKWAGDPAGCVHTIHEDTRKLAYAESVLRCDCKDCKP